MSTTEPVLKPDHGGTRKHFIFTDDHDSCASRSAASSLRS